MNNFVNILRFVTFLCLLAGSVQLATSEETVDIRITGTLADKPYQDALKDSSSAEFKQLSDEVCHMIISTFPGNAGVQDAFQTCILMATKAGSIITLSQVLFYKAKLEKHNIIPSSTKFLKTLTELVESGKSLTNVKVQTSDQSATSEETVDIRITGTLEGRNFEEALADFSSPEFRALNREVCEMILATFTSNPKVNLAFKHCGLVSVKAGSIIVVTSITFYKTKLTENNIVSGSDDFLKIIEDLVKSEKSLTKVNVQNHAAIANRYAGELMLIGLLLFTVQRL